MNEAGQAIAAELVAGFMKKDTGIVEHALKAMGTKHDRLDAELALAVMVQLANTISVMAELLDPDATPIELIDKWRDLLKETEAKGSHK